ncbi:MAG TPA: sulfatase [Candidatus Sulfomarinibacteraceae bacterium]|nr:sulfatase [Candidatus Sulfomarinibacteraceae bacterium]
MQPNIIFITCHDLGKHLSCYGEKTVNSPALSELAESGVAMDNAFCTAPQCSPSRSALHTGRHAHANGVMGLTHQPFNWGLHGHERHVAQILRENGYVTALLGEQHLSHNPVSLGYHLVRPRKAAADVARDVDDFLCTAAQLGEPFYLEVGLVEAHRPYDWGGATPDDALGVSVPAYLPDAPEAQKEFAELQGAIRALDQAIGRILRSVKAYDLAQNTWILFTADHGLAMPRAKGTLYDPGIGVALLMRWPEAGLEGGRRYSELVSHVDVAPTLFEGLGIETPGDVHGHSYWSLLQGEAYQAREAIFAEKTFHTAYEPMRAVRTRDFKLIANFEVGPLVDVADDVRHSPIYPLMLDQITGQRPPLELYDLHSDPWEKRNLAGSAQCAQVKQDLSRLLVEWMRSTDDPLLRGPIPSPFYEQAVAGLRQGS